jgi:16S rRNA U1498 N3-methylase RsmE
MVTALAQQSGKQLMPGIEDFEMGACWMQQAQNEDEAQYIEENVRRNLTKTGVENGNTKSGTEEGATAKSRRQIRTFDCHVVCRTSWQ